VQDDQDKKILCASAVHEGEFLKTTLWWLFRAWLILVCLLQLQFPGQRTSS